MATQTEARRAKWSRKEVFKLLQIIVEYMREHGGLRILADLVDLTISSNPRRSRRSRRSRQCHL